jgi:hypothetical protein
MKTKQIIDEASKIVSDDREKAYGNKKANHNNIAKLWSAYLDKDISPHDVAMLMTLLKVARTKSGENHIDNYIDMCGYAAIAGELVEKKKPKQLEFDFENKSYGGTI